MWRTNLLFLDHGFAFSPADVDYVRVQPAPEVPALLHYDNVLQAVCLVLSESECCIQA